MSGSACSTPSASVSSSAPEFSPAQSGPTSAERESFETLFDVIEDSGVNTLKYLYDFGDGWEHSIKIERIGPADPNGSYPSLIEAVGRCPPEDVGGPLAYEEFLEAIADPKHERHVEMRQWIGADFVLKDVDAAAIGLEIRKMASEWTRPAKRGRRGAPP